jgi:beta-glucanase (GH16 family)
MRSPRLSLQTLLLAVLAALAVGAAQAATAQATHRPCHRMACPAPGDTTVPTASWTNPLASATVSGTLWEATNSGPSGRCEVSASDNVGVARVDFSVDGTALNSELTAPYNCKFDSTTVADGSHTLKAVAYDAAGNSTTTLRTVTVDNVPDPAPGDTTAPTVTWSTPSEGATVAGMVWESTNSGPSGPCEAAAADNVGVTRVMFYVDGVLLNQEGLAPWNCKFDTTTVANGTHTLRAVAYDAAGNTASAQRVVTVQNGVVAPPPPPPPPPPSEDPPPPPSSTTPYGEAANLKAWALDFSDEFDGTSLNTTKWDSTWLTGESGYSPPMNQYMNNCFHSGRVAVANGALRLTASSNTNTSCRKKDGSVAPYAGGVVTSYRSSSDPTSKGYVTSYGYFEARVNLPMRNGSIVNFPAWWTNGAGLNWPENGEIDVMEELGTGKPCWHYHYQDTSGTHQGPGGCIGTLGGQTVDWSGWHTYAARWEPGKITFYYDGRQVATWTTGVVTNPHFLILNYSVDGTVYPDTTMEVDYVRVWK